MVLRNAGPRLQLSTHRLSVRVGSQPTTRLPAFLERRRRLVARYHQQLADLPGLTLPGLRHAPDQSLTSWHLFTVQVDFASLGRSRTEVMMTLREQGIGTQVLYIPVHLQPWYRRTYGYGPGKCPRAESFYQRTLSLPLYPDMTDDDVDRVAKTLRELLRQPS
ncbi:MAG: DegT/DnrJ/EryC1/StrS family aminotransferase [Pirellulaceae bacterium]